ETAGAMSVAGEQTLLYSLDRCHRPRKRAIQYSRDPDVIRRRRGVLDAPPAAYAKSFGAPGPQPRRSLGVAGSRGMTASHLYRFVIDMAGSTRRSGRGDAGRQR